MLLTPQLAAGHCWVDSSCACNHLPFIAATATNRVWTKQVSSTWRLHQQSNPFLAFLLYAHHFFGAESWQVHGSTYKERPTSPSCQSPLMKSCRDTCERLSSKFKTHLQMSVRGGGEGHREEGCTSVMGQQKSWSRKSQILPLLCQPVVQETEEESEPSCQGPCSIGRGSCKTLCRAGAVAHTTCIGPLPQVHPSSHAICALHSTL